ncbi:hypothetical protein KAZ93_03215 [Patescibacteria group bacterium]|nr:hypothetical protein [Patescibacteria group bacterium]
MFDEKIETGNYISNTARESISSKNMLDIMPFSSQELESMGYKLVDSIPATELAAFTDEHMTLEQQQLAEEKDHFHQVKKSMTI